MAYHSGQYAGIDVSIYAEYLPGSRQQFVICLVAQHPRRPHQMSLLVKLLHTCQWLLPA